MGRVGSGAYDELCSRFGSHVIGVDVDASDGGSAIWDLTGVADGDYTITATATDTIGQTASHSIVVTVDNETGASMHIGDLDGSAAAVGEGGDLNRAHGWGVRKRPRGPLRAGGGGAGAAGGDRA